MDAGSGFQAAQGEVGGPGWEDSSCRGTEDKMLSLGLLQGRVCWGSRKRPQVRAVCLQVGGIGV